MIYENDDIETQQDLQDLADRLSAAFQFAESRDLTWAQVLCLTVYKTSEYAKFGSQQNYAEIGALALYAICTSVFRKIDIDDLSDIKKDLSIEIELKRKLSGHENSAALVLLGSFEQILSELVDLKHSNLKTVH